MTRRGIAIPIAMANSVDARMEAAKQDSSQRSTARSATLLAAGQMQGLQRRFKDSGDMACNLPSPAPHRYATAQLALSKEAQVLPAKDIVRKGRSVAWLATLMAVGGTAAAQQGDNPGRSRVTTIDHAIEAYISDDALQALYVRTLDLGEVGPTEVRGGFFYNEDRDLIGIVDLLMDVGDEVDALEEVDTRRFNVRVGARAYGAFLAPEDEDVFGLGLGGEAEYFFNRARTVSVKLGLFYSPDIATFGSADNVKDVSLRLMTRLRDGTDVFVGYRGLEVDLDVADREVDDNLHLGFRRSF